LGVQGVGDGRCRVRKSDRRARLTDRRHAGAERQLR
jgi:hypothetical protein